MKKSTGLLEDAILQLEGILKVQNEQARESVAGNRTVSAASASALEDALRNAQFALGQFEVPDEGEGQSVAWNHAELLRLDCGSLGNKHRAASYERYKLVRKPEENATISAKIKMAEEHGLGKTLASGVMSDGFLKARVPQGKARRPITIQPATAGSRRPHSSQDIHSVESDVLMAPSRPTHACTMAHDRLRIEGAHHAISHQPPGRSNVASLQNDSNFPVSDGVNASKWARCGSERAVTDARQNAVNDSNPRHSPQVAPQEVNLNDTATLDDTKTEPEMNGFQTAKSGYIKMLQKEGKKAAFSGSNSRPNGKFVPPYVKKALDGMNKANGGNQDIRKHNKKTIDNNNNSSDEGPISLRTYELLQLSPGDPLPDELAKLDPMMIEQVCNEVIDSDASISWDDIAGQDAAKRLIQEVVVWPMMNPDIFKGARAPPKGILLFGPPGTGKTLLGKAIASNIDASFFSISASSLTSKWIGEGEKMVKALFAVAGWISPSVIFIDEIDSLLSARKAEGEHESSRRLKTEILVQMEGCDPASSSRKVLLVGATNRPEELDEAARRRMPKQMYIPLPCSQAREEMILRVLGPKGTISSSLTGIDIQKIVEKTQGYSGSDMKNLIQEACQGPIREAVRNAGAQVASLQEKDLRPVVIRDFAIAAKAQRASTEPSEILRYEEYNDKHGANIISDDTDPMAIDDLW